MNNEGLQYLNGLAQWKGQGGFALEKITPVLNYLGNPQNKIHSIHITGTNGKGSVSAFLASILGATSARVGLYTSPHLFELNERVVIDGIPLKYSDINRLAIEIKQFSDRDGSELSFFEAITAIAFMAFESHSLDWMVVEVGLGGRLDATNVIQKPDCSSIVSIDFDHENILGDTLSKIATEKAGIIKENVPVVIGSMSKEARSVIDGRCITRASPLIEFGRDFSVELKEKNSCTYFSKKMNFDFVPSLAGPHQAHNSAVAIAIAEQVGVNSEKCKQGVESTYWPARLEEVHYKGKKLILDSGHNPAGIRSFISFLDKKSHKKIALGFGAIRLKRWEEMIATLIPYVSEWHIMTPEHFDPVSATEVCDFLSRNGISSFNHDRDYVGFLNSLVNIEAPIFALGSMYLIGKIRELVDEPIKQLWYRK